MTHSKPQDFHWVIIQKDGSIGLCTSSNQRMFERAYWTFVCSTKTKVYADAYRFFTKYAKDNKLEITELTDE